MPVPRRERDETSLGADFQEEVGVGEDQLADALSVGEGDCCTDSEFGAVVEEQLRDSWKTGNGSQGGAVKRRQAAEIGFANVGSPFEQPGREFGIARLSRDVQRRRTLAVAGLNH